LFPELAPHFLLLAREIAAVGEPRPGETAFGLLVAK
jgi:hypothetical protein